MLSPGDLVLVTVSGGPDSVCMLDVLSSLSKEFHLALHVAHLNHHMRRQADSDARMVSRLAEERYGIPCTVGHADVLEVAREKGIGLEEAGRIARYRFFRQAKDDVGAGRIALGHTLNDQAETVLMRLMRGSGTKGLAGIPPKKDDVIRPLIDVPRALTEEYCTARGLPTILDVYNLDRRFTRNRVRMKILPMLAESFNPSLVQTLGRVSKVLRWDSDFLEETAHDAFLAASKKQGRVTSIDARILSKMPPALSSRVVDEAWKECSGNWAGLDFERIEDILFGDKELMSLPGGVTVERTKRDLRFFPGPPLDLDLDVSVPGVTQVPEFGVTLSTSVRDVREALPLISRMKSSGSRVGSDSGSNDKVETAEDGVRARASDPLAFKEGIALLDYNKIEGRLHLRARDDGDRFAPLGMGGKEVKLQDFLISRHIPRPYRNFIPLLLSGDEIAWVVGQMVSDKFKVDRGTAKVLQVEAHQWLRSSRNCATIWRSCPTSGRAYS